MAYGCTEEYARVPQWLKRRVALWFHRTGLDRSYVCELHYQDRVTVEGTRCKAAVDVMDRRVELYIAKWFYEAHDGAAVDHVVCHELDHVLRSRVSDTLKEHIGENSVVFKAYTKEDEDAADVFAKMITRAYSRKRDRL